MQNIPVVILCGGSGTRLREETQFIPKPMVPIGGKPMIWHIMKLYYRYGFSKFVLALGYKQEIFRQYFAHYHVLNNDFTISAGSLIKHHWNGNDDPKWEVTLADTGENTSKGERIKRIKKYIACADTFMLTYGDGIGDVNIHNLYEFHKWHGRLATVTGVLSKPRFGEMKTRTSNTISNPEDLCEVVSFSEKPQNHQTVINGGFFVFDRQVFDYIKNNDYDLEHDVLTGLVKDKQLMVYRHEGYWGCMDTIKEMHELDQLWREGEAKWKVW